MAVTTPFLEQWSFFCHVPCNYMPASTATPCPSFAKLCISFGETNCCGTFIERKNELIP